MAGLRFTDLQSRPTEFLDFTSVTLDEFQLLVPPFEAAFQAHMAAWRLDGKPRTARRFSVYPNCPLPTPEDRLLFILAYIKTYALQVVQGRVFGMGQSKANQLNLSRLNHWLPWGQAHPVVVQGTAQFPHQITDAFFPQADAVFHDTAGRVPVHCGSIPQAHSSTVTRTKRPRREGSHGLPVAVQHLDDHCASPS